MAADFEVAFAVLKPILGKYSKRLSVKAGTPTEYTVVTKAASPFPQHKGQPESSSGARRTGCKAAR